MGTWCPNCKDAARFLNTMRNKYFEKGLRIAGFCFERGTPEVGAEKVRRYAQHLNLSYPLVYAGPLKVEEVNKVFPGLKNFISYPTLIIIDKSGKVRGIHAGFNGPATGAYQTFVQHTDSLLSALLAE